MCMLLGVILWVPSATSMEILADGPAFGMELISTSIENGEPKKSDTAEKAQTQSTDKTTKASCDPSSCKPADCLVLSCKPPTCKPSCSTDVNTSGNTFMGSLLKLVNNK